MECKSYRQQQQLPYPYWTPKLHKKPTKKRFIAASSSCATKSTTLCLKLIQSAHRFYCNRIKASPGFNFFWIIENSMELQKVVNNKARNLATYDFLIENSRNNYHHNKTFKGMNKSI